MEKAFLVGTVLSGGKKSETMNSLAELGRLAVTAGAVVSGSAVQTLSKPVPSTFIGKGKIGELTALAKKKEFSTVIFDDELKPAQQKNLSELIPAKILDRTRLILDIFARRAHTREGRLQVELAQMSYMLPRITERYGTFEQQVGGIGTRGPGERKLEVEARHIRDRVAFLKREIESIKLHREVARDRRHNIPLPTVAIVGYTNAGKSTMLNTLVKLYGKPGEPIYADDKLFATLDPTTRRIRLPSGRLALFTDTVGFIKKLPHHLVAAFRSTLEETLDADLLIHLIDAGDKDRNENIKIVTDILKSLETDERRFTDKALIVYNKADSVSEEEKLLITHAHRRMNPDAAENRPEPLLISSTRGTGINAMLSAIEEKLSEQMIETDVYLSFKNLGLLPSLYSLGKVEKVDHKSRGVSLHLKLEKSHLGRLQKLLNNDAKGQPS